LKIYVDETASENEIEIEIVKNVYYLSILQKYIKSKLSFLYDQFFISR